MPWHRLLTGALGLVALLLAGFDGCDALDGGDPGAREALVSPLAAEASIVQEMDGELRLHVPSTCGDPFLEFDTDSFGGFHVSPSPESGGTGPGTVSFSAGGGSLTATEVRSNEVQRVDPTTGRPIEGGAPPGASCTTGSEPDCWTAGEPTAINANAFDALCAWTKGFTSLDPIACGLTVWNSQRDAADPPFTPTIAQALSVGMGGQGPAGMSPLTAGGLLITLAGQLAGWTTAGPDNTSDQVRAMAVGNPFPAGYPAPLAPLVVDPMDGLPPAAALHPNPLTQPFFTANGLSVHLTDEQEALLGCGPFYGTNCDIEGIDLMNVEASAWTQSWSNVEGTFDGTYGGWDTTDRSVAQPGTVGFRGGPICTRYENGKTYILPGCRGPGDSGYDPSVDGSTDGVGSYCIGPPGGLTCYRTMRVHPFTGQEWASEMAIRSWDALMLLVLMSFPDDPNDPQRDDFDGSQPFRTDGCSFANPLDCCNVAATLSMTALAPVEHPSQPPLRRWIWEVGAEYLVTEATGELADFLGWKLFAFGPEQSRVDEGEVGVLFFLSPPDPLPPIPDSPLIVRHPGPNGILGDEDDNLAGVAYGIVQQQLSVDIDIKPGSDRNSMNPFSRLLIPVALLGSEDFDVTDVDVTTLAFAPDGATPVFDLTHPLVYRLSHWDVNRDGKRDLLSPYRTEETGIAFGDTEACLTGETRDGIPFEGCDHITTEPSCGLGVELTLVLAPLMWIWRRRRS